MENNPAKEKILSNFFSDHPESASIILMKSDPSQIAQLISSSPNKSLIATIKVLPVNLLEESLAKLNDSMIASIIGQLNINLAGSIFHQWNLNERMNAKRIESITSMLEPKFASSVETLLYYPINAIGSIMNPTPFSVRENLTAGEVLTILKKEKNRYCRYIYIIDEESTLCGVVPFKEIFYAKKDSLISTLMSSDITFFHPENAIRESFDDLCWRKWDTIPIVDKNKYLIGLIRYETLEARVLGEGKKYGLKNNEISQAGSAISEVFQIGITATLSALMLPLDRSKKP